MFGELALLGWAVFQIELGGAGRDEGGVARPLRRAADLPDRPGRSGRGDDHGVLGLLMLEHQQLHRHLIAGVALVAQ